MYEKEFEAMRSLFTNKGRLEDSTLGAFEVVLLLKDVSKKDINRLKKSNFKFQCCFFNGTNENDPLKNMNNILLFKNDFDKESHLFTIAPRKEWLENEQGLLEFDKIYIRRVHTYDIKNNSMLNESTLRTTDLKNMSKELKEKVGLWVNFESAEIEDVDSAKVFIRYAMNLGISEIVFTGDMEDYEKIFKGIRDFLIKSGWHFDINKAMNSDAEFCSSTTIKKDGMKVVLKQIVKDEDIKNQMWLSSRSHKYIVEA